MLVRRILRTIQSVGVEIQGLAGPSWCCVSAGQSVFPVCLLRVEILVAEYRVQAVAVGAQKRGGTGQAQETVADIAFGVFAWRGLG